MGGSAAELAAMLGAIVMTFAGLSPDVCPFCWPDFPWPLVDASARLAWAFASACVGIRRSTGLNTGGLRSRVLLQYRCRVPGLRICDKLLGWDWACRGRRRNLRARSRRLIAVLPSRLGRRWSRNRRGAKGRLGRKVRCVFGFGGGRNLDWIR